MDTENETNEVKNQRLKEIETFAVEYAAFASAVKSESGEVPEEQLVTLYAIFKKNGRAEALNGNGYGYKKQKSDPNAPATEKQVRAITNMLRAGRIAGGIELDSLTKKEASEIIGKALGGVNSPPSFFTIIPDIQR